MTALIDTSSLLAFCRYYLPLDQDYWEKWIKNEFEEGNLKLLDSVKVECNRVAGGLVPKKLTWFKDYNKTEKTAGLLAPSPAKFNKRINDHFTRQYEKRTLTTEEFEAAKRSWLNNADAHLIIKALQIKHQQEEVCIITEESGTENDGKLFKKIPAIARMLEIEVNSLPEYLQTSGLNASFKFH